MLVYLSCQIQGSIVAMQVYLCCQFLGSIVAMLVYLSGQSLGSILSLLSDPKFGCGNAGLNFRVRS